ncbi:MAG TPA: amino acid transporter, partial [Plasticicumulans sp.]|nr:amino acid transporter [Plasticicumulans sp.]
ETRAAFGPDPVEELHRLTVEVMDDFPNSVCFASKLIFASDSWLGPMLHNQTALSMQRRMHLDGRQMVIVPLKV